MTSLVVLTRPLSTVPVWTAVAPTTGGWLPRLVADIEELLRTRPQDSTRCSGNQTAAGRTRTSGHCR